MHTIKEEKKKYQQLMLIKVFLSPSGTNVPPEQMFEVPREEFQTKKLVNKLIQQVHDPVVLASGALPEWCHALTQQYSFLFPFEVRELFFSCTAFGTSRYVDILSMLSDGARGYTEHAQ